MNSDTDERNVLQAAQTLALLNACADELRVKVALLRQELSELQEQCSTLRSAQLVEANEQLVLAAIHARTIAEQAVSELGALAMSNQHDALTGTPNRALMLDRLENAIAMAKRRASFCAVLFVDLDHFKEINDTLGHAAGDFVLQRTARRLEAVVRESDTVSRHGGDEFLVLLAEVKQASDVTLIADKMLITLATERRAGAHGQCLSASIGIALYPKHGENAATLISRADAAMYRSKKRGGGTYELHHEEAS
jgi:diguanylate cyclase (GGDEF)-like protein